MAWVLCAIGLGLLACATGRYTGPYLEYELPHFTARNCTPCMAMALATQNRLQPMKRLATEGCTRLQV